MKKHICEHVLENRFSKFVFKYDSGLEQEVMSSLLDMIFDENVNFDWSDAIIISFGIIDDLIKERAAFRYLSNRPSSQP
ncbi:MAG: hypothetical protein FVQ82_15845 [Planctomycetes bacterium]|nr:hypothetical protein [Planctomycetota bacterium]